MSLPKVLILNQPFNNDTGGGITLSNLFTGYDRDKLAVAATGQLLTGKINTEICDTYYQLGQEEQKWVFPFSLIKRKYPSGPVTLGQDKIQELGVKKSRLRVKIIMEYFFPILQYMGLFYIVSKVVLSPKLRRWLDDYAPDVLYAQASSRNDIAFCIAVQQYTGKPMIFHMMDDWLPLIGQSGLFSGFWSRKIDAEFRQLLDRCDLLLSISHYMSEEYRRRYGKSFIPFHNPIDVEFWKQHQRKDYRLGAPPTILYAGRTGLGIESSLRTIAEAVEAVNRSLQQSIRFVIQTAEAPEWAGRYACVQHRGLVPYADLPRRFAEADLLILPYDFSEKSLNFIRYSMPTKASEYMMCGSPVVIFAPRETALVRYAEKEQWAEVVTENSAAALARTLSGLVADEQARRKLAGRAKVLAEQKHSAEMVTRSFRNLIRGLTPAAETVGN